jgi:3-hydroxyacyl-CoA dehydrogenase
MMTTDNILVEEETTSEESTSYPINAFAIADLSGLKIGYASRPRRGERKLPQDAKRQMVVEIGRLGQKTGAGWFRYEKGDRTRHPDPELARMIKRKAAELGIPHAPSSGQRGLQDP